MNFLVKQIKTDLKFLLFSLKSYFLKKFSFNYSSLNGFFLFILSFLIIFFNFWPYIVIFSVINIFYLILVYIFLSVYFFFLNKLKKSMFKNVLYYIFLFNKFILLDLFIYLYTILFVLLINLFYFINFIDKKLKNLVINFCIYLIKFIFVFYNFFFFIFNKIVFLYYLYLFLLNSDINTRNDYFQNSKKNFFYSIKRYLKRIKKIFILFILFFLNKLLFIIDYLRFCKISRIFINVFLLFKRLNKWFFYRYSYLTLRSLIIKFILS